jgi:hypothetical protein
MINIYILKCENNKYFIGKINTKHIFKFKNFNSLLYDFTIKYKPLNLYKLIENCDMFDIDKIVKKYMYKYGIYNVRGGSYLDVELSIQQKKTLQSELYTTLNKCYLCGKLHNHKVCPEKIIIEPTNISKYIEINKNTFKNPVVINDYVYYITCCICEKNAIGKVNYTKFDYLITSPSCFDENQDIKKNAVCEICSSNIIGKVLIDNNNIKYLVRGLENGQTIPV